jgi:hypothetical protein
LEFIMPINDQDYLRAQGYSVVSSLTKLDLEVTFAGEKAKNIGNYIVEEWFERKIVGRKVGRADEQPLKDRLATYLGGKYTRFRYKFAESKAAAFEQECRDYHQFDGRSHNEIHPDRPNGTKLLCPHADCRAMQIKEITDSMEPLLGD